MSDGESIEGVVDRLVFENQDSRWAVVRLTVADRGATVTAVGLLAGLTPGSSVRLTGHFEHDKNYGEQFRADSYVPVLPATVEGIRKYLQSGAVEGVGGVIAERLVDHFGAETFDAIEQHPDRLTEVEGIGPKRKARILEAWSDAREVREVMVFLQSHDISPAHAARIYQRYGKNAVAMVVADPYRLATDIRGIGFATADGIAKSLGTPATAPTRARAGVLHTLENAADDGHVAVPMRGLIENARELLDVEEIVITEAIDELADAAKIVVETTGPEPAVFLESLHFAEIRAATRLAVIAAAKSKAVDVDVDRALEWLTELLGVRLGDKQIEGLRQSVASKVLVITGGPGTGKTTMTRAILEVLLKKGRRAVLCAPTGRAAKRLNEATGQEARTIHRVLEFSPAQGGFQRTSDHPIEADIVLVDEGSMIDIRLFSDLLEAVPEHAQLILVGDVDQLPSVGPGNVLQDVIASGVAKVVRLDQIYRQGDASEIVLAAHQVNDGAIPKSSSVSTGDFFVIEREDPDAIVDTVRTVVMERIPRRFGLEPMDIQVLTPMVRGTLGTRNLNHELQAALNPSGAELVRGGRTLRLGDKVMQTRNDYDKDVFNGDLGRVAVLDAEDRAVSVRFDDRLVRYEGAELDALMHAYACTIHKSQGSEYPAVVIPLHTQHFVMLRRNLLYTALTRGRRLVVLVTSRRALQLSVDNDRVPVRHTRLADRLRPHR